jgi:hypothetical protein
MVIIAFMMLLYLVLLIIGIIFLRGSLKRKNRIQIIIFSVCVAFCAFAVLRGFWDAWSIRQKDKEFDKASFKDLNPGDTATITGIIYFSQTDPYDKQDSVNKLWQMKDNRVYVAMTINDFGIAREVTEVIEMSSVQFNGLANYLNYEQQKKDNISFSIKVKARKVDTENRWRLIDTIETTKLHEPPIR